MKHVVEARLEDGGALRLGVFPSDHERMWLEIEKPPYEDDYGDEVHERGPLIPLRFDEMQLAFEALANLQGEYEADASIRAHDEQERAAREQAQLAPVLRLAVPDEPSWEDTDD